MCIRDRIEGARDHAGLDAMVRRLLHDLEIVVAEQSQIARVTGTIDLVVEI